MPLAFVRSFCYLMHLLTRTGADGMLPGWHTIIRGLAPQAGGFRRRSNKSTSVALRLSSSFTSSVSHACCKWCLHLQFRIIPQYVSDFQPRTMILLPGTRNILPTKTPDAVQMLTHLRDVRDDAGLQASLRRHHHAHPEPCGCRNASGDTKASRKDTK